MLTSDLCLITPGGWVRYEAQVARLNRFADMFVLLSEEQ
jgi:hypothetical protein